MPTITPLVAVSFVWMWMFDPQFGMIDKITGLDISWLNDSRYAMPAVIIMTIWKDFGYATVLYLAGIMALPRDVYEAAQIDGAGHFKILMQIVIPLSKAMLAVMVLYYGVGIWNAWFWGSTIIRKREMYPLQVILREILMQNDVGSMTAGVSVADQESIGMSIKYATIIVATVPILCVYPFLQKYFTKGVMVGAVKE